MDSVLSHTPGGFSVSFEMDSSTRDSKSLPKSIVYVCGFRAEDTQLYISVKPGELSAVKHTKPSVGYEELDGC